jgi:hypothetical protein
MFSRIARGLYIELRASLRSLHSSSQEHLGGDASKYEARYPYPARSIAPRKRKIG